MKILIIGDLHGQKSKLHYKNYDIIIAPGDFCYTDTIRPLMFQSMKMANPDSKVEWYDIAGKEKAKENFY